MRSLRPAESMPSRTLLRQFWPLLLCVYFFVAPAWAAEVNIEALLADINRKPPEQRLKALIDGARKEGLVSHYGSTNTPDNDEITRGFAKQYPFIEIRYTRLGAEQGVNRAMTQHRASKTSTPAATPSRARGRKKSWTRPPPPAPPKPARRPRGLARSSVIARLTT